MKFTNAQVLFFCSIMCAVPACTNAEDATAPVDKSGYWLLSPTPDDEMREFSTDRPGKTHSPITIDAGHFQIESDFFTLSNDRYSTTGQSSHALSVGTPILKAGITDWVDFEMGFAFYNESRTTDAGGARQTAYGFGDVLLGSKINLFGNDGGNQSLALLPFVKIPTASEGIGNGLTEYTLNIPYTIALGDPWSLTLEPVIGLLKNFSSDGHHGDYSFIINLSRPVFTKNISAAIELASEFSSDHTIPDQYTLDPSIQWLVTKTLQLDAGMYIGLNRAAPDYQLYSGISYRF